MIMDDRTALARSNAGMRLVAQMTFLNRGEFERLGDFIGQSYAAAALAEQDADTRLADLRALQAAAGALRVRQVLAVDKHRAAVLLQARQGDDLYYAEIAVEEDYPHRITEYHHKRMIENAP
jgi:hypothetical protein